MICLSTLFLLFLANYGRGQSVGAGNAAGANLSNPQIVERIDAAVYQRANAIVGYTVQEQYNLYRNAETNPSAQETIHTVYHRSTGKQYTPIAQSGSAFFRGAVIDKVLAGEKEINLPENREASWITSKNYEMEPDPAPVEINGRPAIAVTLKPLRKSPHLFGGKIWVDPSNFTVIRIEGVPSESPSFFAGATTIARDYVLVDGFSMATHAEAHSHSALLGDTTLKIDYTNYKIQRAVPSAQAPLPR